MVDDLGDFVRPLGRSRKHLDDRGYARNALRAHAYSLALYFTYLGEHGLAFEAVGIRELAALSTGSSSRMALAKCCLCVPLRRHAWSGLSMHIYRQ